MKKNYSLQYIKMKKKVKFFEEVSYLENETGLNADILYNKKFTDVSFDKIDNISIENSVFINCKFSDSIKRSVFFNCSFENCEMSNILISDCGIHKSLFKDSHMIGISIADTKLKTCKFQGNNMKLANIFVSNKPIENCVFSDNDLTGASFEETEIIDSDFEYNNMCELQVRKSCFREIDLSSNKLNGIMSDADSIRGAIVSMEQAIDFINILGLKIK